MDLKQWTRKNPDRVGAWVLVILGALALWRGWEGVSTTEYPAEQLPYIISGGIGGALLVAFGATLLLSADLRDEWRKLDRIERRLAAAEDDAADDALDESPGQAQENGTSTAGGTKRRSRRQVLAAGGRR